LLKKNPSCLRKTDKKSILSFGMQQLYEELEEKVPFSHRIVQNKSTHLLGSPLLPAHPHS
jgi:hypothetical protein